MRTFLLLLLLTTISLVVHSQDIIHRTNGDKVECRITKEDSITVYFTIIVKGSFISTSLNWDQIAEITYDTTEIIYDTNRPTFANDTIEVVKVFGGVAFYQNNYGLKMKEVIPIIRVNDEAYVKIQNARSKKTIADILGIAGGLLIGWPVGIIIAGGEPNWVSATIGAGLVIIAIPISLSSHKDAREAVGIYNRSIGSTTSFWDKSELNFSLGQNGIGLMLTF
jgi:hypothetical protein